ncbi:MAG: transposase [Candidatus Aminicenantes bacterium]|nr:transposase [Candidatus Aminicenantes bacterium]
MRRARLTWQGAYHHVMARGINGMEIFSSPRFKQRFMELLYRQRDNLGIPVYAWCVMENHYHLVLENRNGRMSEFMKRVNGSFGQYFRYKTKSCGVVFQGRFKSLLIQDDRYLIQVIRYVLRNPVKAGIVTRMESYRWSSARFYFSRIREKSPDIRFVEQLFSSREQLLADSVEAVDEPTVIATRMGPYVGDESFSRQAVQQADRRTEAWSDEAGRRNDGYFQPVYVAENEFKHCFGVHPKDIDCRKVIGKRMRGEWLVWLRERCGLTYREVSQMGLFADLELSSLGAVYRNTLKRRERE